MVGGTGETSYAKNSILQKKALSLTKAIREEAISSFYREKLPRSLGIADLGCSSGPNSLFVTCELIEIVEKLCRELNHESPEYIIFLNDLPGNDFNNIFTSLECFKKKLSDQCYITGVPSSFFGRILPTSSLHFVHSSNSVHWLSQVPESIEDNKGNICVTSTSPSYVRKAYYHQFQRNFSSFLKCRAEELVEGGRMVLTVTVGSSRNDPSGHESFYIWELLAEALNDMVLEGIIKEDQLDSFNIPLYYPSASELELAIEKEGSFIVNRMEIFELSWKAACGEELNDNSGYKVAQLIRAAIEPMLVSHFGEAIIDQCFHRYQNILADRMAKEKTVFVFFTMSLTKTT